MMQAQSEARWLNGRAVQKQFHVLVPFGKGLIFITKYLRGRKAISTLVAYLQASTRFLSSQVLKKQANQTNQELATVSRTISYKI